MLLDITITADKGEELAIMLGRRLLRGGGGLLALLLLLLLGLRGGRGADSSVALEGIGSSRHGMGLSRRLEGAMMFGRGRAVSVGQVGRGVPGGGLGRRSGSEISKGIRGIHGMIRHFGQASREAGYELIYNGSEKGRRLSVGSRAAFVWM